MLLLAGCDSSIFEEIPTYEQSSLVEVGDKAPLFSATLLDGTNTLTELIEYACIQVPL